MHISQFALAATSQRRDFHRAQLDRVQCSEIAYRCRLASKSSSRSDPTSSRFQISRDRLERTGSNPPLKIAVAESISLRTSLSYCRMARLVEPDGIEPTTSCLQSRRSPN